MLEISQSYYIDNLIDAFKDNEDCSELHKALISATFEIDRISLCIKHNKLKQAQVLSANAELIIQTLWGINSRMGISSVNVFSIKFNKKTLAMARIDQQLDYQTRMQLIGLLGDVK